MDPQAAFSGLLPCWRESISSTTNPSVNVLNSVMFGIGGRNRSWDEMSGKRKNQV